MKRRFSATTPFSLRGVAVIGLFTVALTACAPEVHFRGNTPEPDRLSLIKPGAQSREQVIQLLGSPTMIATFDKNIILYVGQKTRTVTFREPEVLERTVVAIGFGPDNRVTSVEKFSLADGKVVQLVSRTTPTPGRQFTVLQQLLGNFGRFESDKALTGPGSGGTGSGL